MTDRYALLEAFYTSNEAEAALIEEVERAGNPPLIRGALAAYTAALEAERVAVAVALGEART